MGRNRFTVAAVERLPLSDDDWIEVKKELNTGDQKRLDAAGIADPVMLNGRPFTPINLETFEIERLAIYLTNWSFRDANDEPVPLKTPDGKINLAAIRSLDIESFNEIHQAVQAFLKRTSEEKKASKLGQKKVEKSETATLEPTST